MDDDLIAAIEASLDEERHEEAIEDIAWALVEAEESEPGEEADG